jgi:hypothetical protein
MHAYEIYTNPDRYTTVLSDIRWYIMVPPNDSEYCNLR